MSDAPEEEAPKATKAARKRPARRTVKAPAAAAGTALPVAPPEAPAALAAVEPATPAPKTVTRAPRDFSEEKTTRPARPPRDFSGEDEKPRPARAERKPAREEVPSPAPPARDAGESGEGGDPVATFGEPPSSEAQGTGGKKRRRRKKKHGQGQGPAGGNGGGQQIFQTSPTRGGYDTVPPAAASAGEGAAENVVASAPAPQPVQPSSRPKADSGELAKKAWKIFLSEVSEEGLALIGDNDARELSRRCFRLAEIFLEEASRRQGR